MTTNPEVSEAKQNSPEVQQVLESTKAGTDALKEEITTISSTKTELNWLGKFFSKLGDAWKELKEWNISKAIAILFGTDQQESQQTSSTSSSESSESSTTTTTWNESTTTSTTWTDNNGTTNAPTSSKEKEPKNKDIVPIKEYLPNIQYDLKYASTDNFIKKKMYKDSVDNYLKLEYQAIKKLKKAEELAEQKWYKLKIWDAYRPDEAQTLMWKTYKPWMSYKEKKKIIAPPISLFWWSWSKHWKWQAVDVTLTDKDGKELWMPTKFDEFKWCKYNDIKSWNTPEKKRALELRDIMYKAGFKPYDGEWWHFDSLS